MKIEINGIEREGQIVSVPRGGFCIVGEGLLKFPLFAFICNTIYSDDVGNSKVLICPILDCSYTSFEEGDVHNNYVFAVSIRNCVKDYDIKYLLKWELETNCDGHVEEDDILYWLDAIVDEFEIHGTPFSRNAKRYIKLVRIKKKLDI